MADVAVETLAQAATEWNAQRYGVVWTDEDIGYLIFANNVSDLVYRKTTDGGASWGSQVPVSGAISSLGSDIWFDKWTPGDSGTVIHIWWMDEDASDVHYRSLDTSSDTLGTLRTVFDGATFAAGGNRAAKAISGTKAVGGNLYVQFWGDVDGERGFYRSTDAGANWTSRTDGADGDAVDEVICLPDDDAADTEDIVMIYWDRSANEISIKKYDDSGNFWGETAIVFAIDYTEIMQLSAVVRHSDGHIILAAWNAFDSTTADLHIFDIILATPSSAQKTDVVSNSDDCAGAALFIDQNNDDLYCAYIGNEDGSEIIRVTATVFYKKSDDGGATWGLQTAYQEGTADDERYVDAGHSTPGAAAGRFEPVFFNDDLRDLFVNKVNSVEITAIVDVLGAVQLDLNIIKPAPKVVAY